MRRFRLASRRIFIPNVVFTLMTHGLLAFHVGTFNSLWFVFLSTPRFNPAKPYPPDHKRQSLPFHFTGGLGLPPPTIGLALAILGVIGISLQLLLYPWLSFKLGNVWSLRMALIFFPITYAVAPYLAVVPSRSPPPHQADGAWIWLAMIGVLCIQVFARTFALPSTTILINNCTPHPSVLGTVHGIAQSVSAAARTVGPIAGGWGYGMGLSHGIVGAVWWALSALAVLGYVASGWVYEGSGHEIKLEGEEEDR